jgi:cytidylate kinase
MVWREVINEAARRAGAPEMALAAIDDLGLLDLRPSQQALQAYQGAVREVMEDLAAEGAVVIVGRAGQVILGGRPDVLHVRIIAPPKVRVARIASLQEIPWAAARAQVEESDRTRRDYLQRTYHVAWNDPQLYDLVLNTARIPVASAEDLICQALRGLVSDRQDG